MLASTSRDSGPGRGAAVSAGGGAHGPGRLQRWRRTGCAGPRQAGFGLEEPFRPGDPRAAEVRPQPPTAPPTQGARLSSSAVRDGTCPRWTPEEGDRIPLKHPGPLSAHSPPFGLALGTLTCERD